MLRDYVPKGQALPGVRSLEGQSWPSGPTFRRSPAISFNNGRVYIDYRRDLLSRYAARWMGSLHDYDPTAYGDMLFQLSADLAEENAPEFVNAEGDPLAKIVCNLETFFYTCWTDFFQGKQKAKIDRHLRCIIQLGQSSIIFTVLDDLFSKWLELIPHDHRQVLHYG
jgi:hypothetical protein